MKNKTDFNYLLYFYFIIYKNCRGPVKVATQTLWEHTQVLDLSISWDAFTTDILMSYSLSVSFRLIMPGHSAKMVSLKDVTSALTQHSINWGEKTRKWSSCSSNSYSNVYYIQFIHSIDYTAWPKRPDSILLEGLSLWLQLTFAVAPSFCNVTFLPVQSYIRFSPSSCIDDEIQTTATSSPAHPENSQWGLDSVRTSPCVKMSRAPEPLFHNLSLINPGVVTLEHSAVSRGKKKPTDGRTWPTDIRN